MREPYSPKCPDCHWFLKFLPTGGMWQAYCRNPNCKKNVVVKNA